MSVMKSIPTISVFAGLMILAGLGYYALSVNRSQVPEAVLPEGETHKVTLTSGGYEPKELTIKQGDVVVFSTTREFDHWPASNVHPTHDQYPGFDPKRPLRADESWSFQFTKTGTWSFHDHLNSTFNGEITVTP